MDGMLGNRAKAKLASGRVAVGTVVVFIRNPGVMKMIAAGGYDFVFIDMEHSSFSFETVNDMCAMAREAGIVPLVRPYSHDPGLGNKIQDLGAMGLIYPHVETRSQVDSLRHFMFYPPDGDRPSFRGANLDYRTGSRADLYKFVNANMLLVILIESREGVERIEEILTGGGIDVIHIGTSDLSNAYGVPGERRHPLVLEAIDKIVAACIRHNVPVGSTCDSYDDAQELVRRGLRWLIYPDDVGLLMRTYRESGQFLQSLTDGAVQRQTKRLS
jgi:2-keto-3-deoxy-L-rhamnonate aldolase RhmA